MAAVLDVQAFMSGRVTQKQELHLRLLQFLLTLHVMLLHFLLTLHAALHTVLLGWPCTPSTLKL